MSPGVQTVAAGEPIKRNSRGYGTCGAAMGEPRKHRSSVPGKGSTAPLEVGGGQPVLSSAKLKLLADQIVALDGVTHATACQQINEMLNFDLSGCCYPQSGDPREKTQK
jgi:hypothetical protein